MTDIEKRAHDIAVSILPSVIEVDKIQFFVPTETHSEKFNSYDITELYCTVYEALLQDLQEYGEF